MLMKRLDIKTSVLARISHKLCRNEPEAAESLARQRSGGKQCVRSATSASLSLPEALRRSQIELIPLW